METDTALLLKSFLERMSSNMLFTAGFLLCALAVVIALIIAALQIGRKIGLLEGEKNAAEMLRAGREDAVKRSRAVLGGQMAEQIAPLLDGFPCNPADVRFIGKPVDFIAFPGIGEGRDISEVLFIEVKTGTSVLSKREREIKSAVEAGKIRYIIYNPDAFRR
jgi:predicted Holliday junction resolvase-like endonuclease